MIIPVEKEGYISLSELQKIKDESYRKGYEQGRFDNKADKIFNKEYISRKWILDRIERLYCHSKNRPSREHCKDCKKITKIFKGLNLSSKI